MTERGRSINRKTPLAGRFFYQARTFFSFGRLSEAG